EQAEELAPPHLEVEAVDGDERPVLLAELLGPDRRVPHVENVSAAAGLQCAPPGVCPSGQRERAVNPSAQPTEFRILPPPLTASSSSRVFFQGGENPDRELRAAAMLEQLEQE